MNNDYESTTNNFLCPFDGIVCEQRFCNHWDRCAYLAMHSNPEVRAIRPSDFTRTRRPQPSEGARETSRPTERHSKPTRSDPPE